MAGVSVSAPAPASAAPGIPASPVSAPASAASAPASAAALRERRIAELGVLAVVVVWSANFVVVKASIASMGPLSFAALRFLLASVTLLAILRWREGSFRWPGAAAPGLFALGALGFGVYQVLWTTGLTQVTAGDSALLIAASPVATAILAGLVGMDVLSVPKVGGALFAFAGVALVIAGAHELTLGASLAGDVMTLAAAFLWAVYAVGSARVLRGLSPLQLTTWTIVAGSLVLLPFGIAEAAAAPPALDPAALAGVAYAGILAAALSNVVVMHAIALIGPTSVTASQFLVPAGAVVLGALFLAEPVGAGQVFGGAVIVLGVWLTRRDSLVPARVRSRLSSRA